MKNKICVSALFTVLFAFMLCESGFTQADYYDVNSGVGKGIRFWNTSNNFKIHMGSNYKYHYGPVTGFSIKMNMSNQAARGWTWGVPNVAPIAALNTRGYFQIAGNFTTEGSVTSMSGNYYFDNGKRLFSGSTAALYWKSANLYTTQIILQDGDGTKHGTLGGSSNGSNFGLIDGDNNWSYLAKKNQYTALLVQGSEKMRINANGNIGIGTDTPDNKLDVNGIIRAKEVKVESGWSDYVFYDDYQLPTLEEEEKHIEENGYLLGFESEEAMEGMVSLGDVSRRQQAKIEEVMLHLIEMKKENEQLKKEIEQMKELLDKE